MVANNHLELTTAFNHHNHARVFLQPFRIRFLILFQFEAKPGSAVDKTDDVLFSANVAENILCSCLVFHLDFLTSDARRHLLTEYKNKKTRERPPFEGRAQVLPALCSNNPVCGA